MDSEIKKIAANTAALALVRVVALVISFITIPILTRYLGPDLFGDYSLVLTLIGFLLIFTDLGLATIATREEARRHELVGHWARQAFILRTIVALGVSLLSLFAIFLTNYPSVVKFGFLIALLTVFTNVFQTGYLVILQTQLRVYLYSFAELINRLVTAVSILAVTFFALRLNFDAQVGTYLILLGTGLGSVLGLVYLMRTSGLTGLITTKFDKSISKKLLIDSTPLALVTVLGLVHYRFDTILLSLLKGSYDVGIYNLSYRLLDITLAFPAVIMASIFPLLSSTLIDVGRFKTIAQKSLEILALMAVPIACGVYITAPQIIGILGGPSFRDSVLPLQLLIFASVASYLNTLFAYMVIIKNKQKSILIISVIAVTLNIALNLILIPYFTFNASAAITLVSEFFGMVAMYLLAVRSFGFHLHWGKVLKTAVAGLTMLGILFPLQSAPLLAVVIIGVIIYVGLVLALRIFDLSEYKEIMPGFVVKLLAGKRLE